MKIEDLRIGNLIRVINNNTSKISDNIVVDITTFNDIKSSHYNPIGIPLTEEILLKMDFKFNRLYYYHEDTTQYYDLCINVFSEDALIQLNIKDRFNPFLCYWETHDENGKPISKGNVDYEYHIPLIGVSYVHELQNLFYILTKNELKFII